MYPEVQQNMNWQQACENGSLDFLHSLRDISHFTDVKTGERPLHYAAKGGDTQTVEYLLGRGARIDETDKFGRTALFMAVLYTRLEVVRLLLFKHASPNIHCNCGTSVVSKAAENGDVTILNLLLNNGATTKTHNIDGETPMDLAERNGHDFAATMIRNDAKVKLRKFIDASKKGDLELMEDLVTRCGVDPFALSRTGEPALHLATRKGQEGVVEFLLKNEAISKKPARQRVQARDRNKHTALYWARKERQSKIEKLLLNVDPNLLE